MTHAELERKLSVLMGGRAAEALIWVEFSTGASDDLAKATELAYAMATRYGMVPGLGHMAYDLEPVALLAPSNAPTRLARTYSDGSAHEVEAAIKTILARAFHAATAILARNRALLENAATALLAQETLTEQQLTQLFAAAVLPDDVTASAAEPRHTLSSLNAC
jgi:cell division protease FtsH